MGKAKLLFLPISMQLFAALSSLGVVQLLHRMLEISSRYLGLYFIVKAVFLW